MKTRPTPETDAAEEKYGNGNAMHAHCHDSSHIDGDFADFARQLERERDEAREAAAIVPELVAALEAMADYYVQLVNTGDAGQWDPEGDDVVIKSRAAIAKAKGGQP